MKMANETPFKRLLKAGGRRLRSGGFKQRTSREITRRDIQLARIRAGAARRSPARRQAAATRLLQQFGAVPTASSTGGAGRPRGSYKYTIPGKGPVPIHVYKRWLTAAKRLARLQGGQVATQINPPINQQPVPQQQVAQPVQVQQQPQQEPSTVGREAGGNILNAPNFLRGELTNIGSNTPVKGVDQTNRPITNPQGDYYTEIDPLSGKPILHRRVRERWLTNE